jgi:hypothetical protein
MNHDDSYSLAGSKKSTGQERPPALRAGASIYAMKPASTPAGLRFASLRFALGGAMSESLCAFEGKSGDWGAVALGAANSSAERERAEGVAGRFLGFSEQGRAAAARVSAQGPRVNKSIRCCA